MRKNKRSAAAAAFALGILLLSLGGCARRGEARQTDLSAALETAAQSAAERVSALKDGCLEISDGFAVRALSAKKARPCGESGKHGWGAGRRIACIGAEGTAGRLSIPSAGISVALYLPGEDAQTVTDAPDSACWMEYAADLNPVIGDHVNQEFAALPSVQPGDVCLIVKDGMPYRYRCVSVGYGQNTEEDVLDENGRSLFRAGKDRLCMYTCADGWRYVFIAEWQCERSRPLHQLELFFMTD